MNKKIRKFIFFSGIFFIILSLFLVGANGLYQANIDKDEELYQNYERTYSDTFPDKNFLREVISHIYFNVNEVSDTDFVSYSLLKLNKEELDKVKTLDISHKNIKSLSGIETMKELSSLNASSNEINKVNLKLNTNLRVLDLSNNSIYTINLNSNNNLKHLNLSNNYLSSLEFNHKTAIEELYLDNNKLKDINLFNYEEAKIISLKNNEITSLDLRRNLYLKSFDLSHNKIKNIDLINQKDIENVNASFTDIKSLKLYSPKLSGLNISNTKINDMDLPSTLVNLNINKTGINKLDTSKMKDLKSLDISNTYLDHFIFKNNDNLEDLRAESSHLRIIDISNNKELKSLNLNDNLLKEINLENNSSLINLNLSTNFLKSVNTDKLVNLKELDLSNNYLEELDLKSNKELLSLNVSENKLNKIDLKDNNKLIKLNLNDNIIDKLDFSNNKELESLKMQSIGLTKVPELKLEKLKFLDISKNNIYDLSSIEDKLKKGEILSDKEEDGIAIIAEPQFLKYIININDDNPLYKAMGIDTTKEGIVKVKYKNAKIEAIIVDFKDLDKLLNEKIDISYYKKDDMIKYEALRNEVILLYNELDDDFNETLVGIIKTKAKELEKLRKKLMVDSDRLINNLKIIKKSSEWDNYNENFNDEIDNTIKYLKGDAINEEKINIYVNLLNKINNIRPKGEEVKEEERESKEENTKETEEKEILKSDLTPNTYSKIKYKKESINNLNKYKDNSITNKLVKDEIDKLNKEKIDEVKRADRNIIKDKLKALNRIKDDNLDKDKLREKNDLIKEVNTKMYDFNMTNEEAEKLVNKMNNMIETSNTIENPPTAVSSYIIILASLIVVSFTILKINRLYRKYSNY